MTKLLRPNIYSIWTPILFFSFLRLLIAPSFGLGVDEAHYVLYALHPSLSYFDHPPFVGWFHIPLTLISQNELTARIPAILLGASISYMIHRLLLMRGSDKKAIFWAVVALNSSFVFGALFLMMMPDTILLFFMLLLIFTFLNLMKHKTLQTYILFGLVLGFCGMSKYTAILFVIAIFGFIIQTKRYDILFSKFTFVAIFVSLIVISPVIARNIQNSFASFAFQSSHVAGGSTFSFATLGKNIVSQFGAYSPPLFIIGIYGLYKGYKSDLLVDKILYWFVVVAFVFFIYTESSKSALPHWISPFFVIAIPYGIVALFESNMVKTAHYSVIFSFIVTVAVYLELFFKIGSFADLKSPFRDIYGWDLASKQALSKKSKDSDLAVLNWSEASRVSLYSETSIFVADDRKDQFDIWYNQNPNGKDFLFVITKSSKNSLENRCICSDITNLGSYEARLNGNIVEGFEYILCKNYQGLKR